MIELAKIAKTALTGITGINTLAIGIEPNLSPKQYPMIRIVPVESRPDQSISQYKRSTMDIYIGLADKNDADGHESIYEILSAWEEEVLVRLNTAEGAAFFWKSTRQDEDRLQAVKVIVMRFEVLG